MGFTLRILGGEVKSGDASLVSVVTTLDVIHVIDVVKIYSLLSRHLQPSTPCSLPRSKVAEIPAW